MAVLQAAQQNKIEFSDTAALRQLSEEILNAEIASRVLLHHAKEAKIEITDDQVNQLVENRLNEMRRNFPSETAFQSALEEAGQTLLGLKEIYREQSARSGKPEKVLDKIVEGRLGKYYQEVCLLEQAFIKNPDTSVGQLMRDTAAKIGENIQVRRFARFQLGQ